MDNPRTLPEVLFVCVQNAGRSQMAAALTHALSAGRVHVRSAGSDPAGQPVETVRAIRDDIRGRVEQLLGELDVPVAPLTAGMERG